MHGSAVRSSGESSNEEMLAMVAMHQGSLAIEMIASYGMPVGSEIFDTCVWIGRFLQAHARPASVKLVKRHEVKMHLCGSMRAKDSHIRQRLIDIYGPGKEAAIGRKSSPGPLYGVKGHAWAALAVGVTAARCSQ